MIRFCKAAALALLASFAFAASAAAQEWSVRSPRGRTEMQVRTTQDGGLQYRVLLRAQRNVVAVDWSTLGITTQVYNTFDMRTPVISDFSSTITYVSQEAMRGSDDYTMRTGKRLENHAAYAQLSLTFRDNESERLLRLDARAYDEGAAFRYVMPETSLSFHAMTEEKTTFNIGLGGTHWGQPYDFYTMYHPSYETFYENVPTGTATPSAAGVAWGFPSLFDIRGAYVLIHESNLDATFHGSHLAAEAPNGVYRIVPPNQNEAQGYGANVPSSPLPWTMPWRMMIVSDDLADVAESNLVFHLAAPSTLTDESWIHPGVASWNWLSDHDSSRNMDKLKGFIDLAGDMGWPYTLIDANWNLGEPNAMETLVAYAAERNVGLTFWYNSGGRHNIVTEQPRNIMDDRALRRAEFARLEALGVKGVKIDFFQSDKQDIIRLYTEIMEDAAEFHLLADFHGSTIPRGWERTYPHLMTMEAVRGAEFYSFSGEPGYALRAPEQNTIHPFLRNVIGAMDYTPVHFSQFAINRITTNAHEAALGVIFESGLQHMSDSVAGYRGIPDDWRRYLTELPTVWDDTRILAGAPGDYVVLARRRGDRWYVAGINGRDATRSVTVRLSQLPGANGPMLALTDDGENGFASATSARRPGSVRQEMRPNGGFVLVIGQ